MALDRRIIIKIEAPGTRDGDGTYIPGPVTAYPVWAERRAAGSSDSATSGGFITQSAQNYNVRWFQALELSDISFVEVEDEYGITWEPIASRQETLAAFNHPSGAQEYLMPSRCG